jgi:Protein of unknown function (DUF3604)
MPRRSGGFLALVLLAALGCSAEPPDAGRSAAAAWPSAAVAARSAVRAQDARAVAASPAKQILFGDLHVHTTFSADAFLYALPILGGEGAHPPADACDFARWCAGLDFFSINDHAEGLTPSLWTETQQSLRECDARNLDPALPDLVPFLGWEWTQTGATPDAHYGHRNVVLEALEAEQVPTRPISSRVAERASTPPGFVFSIASGLARVVAPAPYVEMVDRFGRMAAVPPCQEGVDVRALPPDCLESVATPGELFAKLDQWALPSLVIPHGLAWGIHAPPGGDLRSQLRRSQHDPTRERLIEVMSGHGNGEQYRAALDEGAEECPEPTADFLPCCWRAGELMRERCGTLTAAECDARVDEARQLALAAGAQAHRVIPDTRAEDWLDCDQCRDCFKPASFLRPRLTAQYGAALVNASERDAQGRPLRYRWGFIASTDTHSARAGSGYKQLAREAMTDQRGPPTAEAATRIQRWVLRPSQQPPPVRYEPSRLLELFDGERTASFLYPGGIVAVHAAGRDRAAIWAALERREVYGTSGPRMLLWFDLVNGPAGRSPMGSEVALAENPRFEARAVGAAVEQPGCPAEAVAALGAERTFTLCRDECHHPGEARQPIAAIEVVRIRPQRTPDEPVAPLIDDPWQRFACPLDPAGCVVRFEDDEFAASGRDTVYYVRALQAETAAINGANLRTEFDADGRAVRVKPCFGDYRTPASDDCLAPVQERAWSSPIYADFAGAR